MTKNSAAFSSYLTTKGFKNTRQRRVIVESFFSLDRHVSAEELYQEVVQEDPGIGLITVYRTLKLLKEAGLARESQFGNSFGRFEPVHAGEHHDHLICVKCGTITEFESAKIEKLQDLIADEHGFKVFDHKLELYGLCANCSQNSN